MALRYLIYATGTTYNGTIVRESAINNPGVNEASYYTDFVIPEIQPLYLWQVTPLVNPNDVIPNTETKISNYEVATEPAPTSQDLATYGEVTGLTATKIDKVSGQTGKVPVFTSTGNLQSGGYTIPQLTGLTTYTFQGSGGTIVTQTGNNIKITSTVPTGTTVTWGSIVGTLSNQTDLWNQLTGMTAQINTKLATSVFQTYTGTTVPNTYYNKTQINNYTGVTNTLIGTKVAKVTGATQNDIVIFGVGGEIADSGKLFTTTVQSVGSATNNNVPTELAVRNAINSAVSAAVILQGDWNATTNNPSLTGPLSAYTTGFAWRVSVSGTTSLSGINLWRVGDMAIKGANTWIKVNSEDISAIWGNISGTLSNQTDLQNALNAKLNTSIYQTYTGTTAPATFANKAAVNYYTGTTAPATYKTIALVNYYTGTTAPATFLSKVDFSTFSGTTLPANYYNKTQINYYTGTTAPATFLSKSAFNTFTGTTLPANYYNKTQINAYTGVTKTAIDSKLPIATFTGYTASTKNKDKKIQVVSTSTINANVVVPAGVAWASAPYSADTYLWTVSSASTIFIKSAGTYEVSYHVLLKNDGANQTHSVGAYIIKNNAATLTNTATAGMIVGPNASGELSLPPVIQTFAFNDRLDLAVFRIGNAGTVNLVANSVTMTLNKLT